jgi:type VI secretion system secreted protein VgrG
MQINKKEKHTMKETYLVMALRNAAKRIPPVLGFALAVALPHYNATAQNVNLGTADNFAVLAGSTVTSSDNTAIIGGNVGVSPGTAVTGFPPGTIAAPYTIVAGGSVAAQAEADLYTAYNYAAGLAPTQNLTGQDLGGQTLTPGVYFFASSAGLTGTLTLNDLGNPDAVFVFQIGSTLTTAGSADVVLENGAEAGNVFWQVGSSATLGTGTTFEGNILADASITLDTGADLTGSALAMNGAVTLDDNAITAVPEPGTLLLLGVGLAAFFAFGRRFSSHA